MTTANSFETTIITALDAEKLGVKFPLKFNDVWQESGYTRKNNAVKAFKENCSDLIQGEDYEFDYSLSQNTKQRGRPYSDILLTVEAYNFFLARARTPEGTAKLKYLILIEKNYRENLNRQFAASEQPQNSNKEINQLKYQVEKFKTSSEHFDKLTKYMAKRINKTSKMQLNGHFKLALLYCCINFCHEYQEEFNFTKAQYRAKIAYLKDKVNEALSESEQLSYAFDIDMSEMYPEEFKAMKKALDDDFATFIYLGET